MSKCSRLEKEILLLRQELANMRSDRDEMCRRHATHFRNCGGGESCAKLNVTCVKRTDKSTKPPNQDLYIAYLEEQIQRTRLKYKKQMGEVKSSASLLETKLQNVRQEMSCISARAKQVDTLQNSINVLKSKLERRDMIIARYNKQHAAFLGLITNLDRKSIQKPIGPQKYKDLSKSVSIESNGCDGDRKDSDKCSKHKPSSSITLSCLGTALRNKLMRK